MGPAKDAAWRSFGHRWWRPIIAADVLARAFRVLRPLLAAALLLAVALTAWRWLADSAGGVGGADASAATDAVAGAPAGVWLLGGTVVAFFALRPWPGVRRVVVIVGLLTGLVLLCAGGC